MPRTVPPQEPFHIRIMTESPSSGLLKKEPADLAAVGCTFTDRSVVCCTLSAARCPLHAVCCTLHAVRCLLHAVCCTLSPLMTGLGRRDVLGSLHIAPLHSNNPNRKPIVLQKCVGGGSQAACGRLSN